MKRRVFFTTDSDKFYGVVLERLLRNEAALEALSEEIATIRAQMSDTSIEEVKVEIARRRDEAYDRLAASLIAHLTLDQNEDPLDRLKEASEGSIP